MGFRRGCNSASRSVRGVTVASSLGLVVTIGARDAFAHDWYVDASYPNCSGSDGSATKPYCTINGALTVAASGDTIWIAAGTYVEQLDLQKSLTLVGTAGAAATVVTMNLKGWIARTGAGTTVDLSALTLRDGGNTNLNAGGLTIGAASSVTVTDCVLDHCVANGATWDGGAIYSTSGGVVTLERCTLKNNVGQSRGGAIYASGGSVTLRDCTLTGNVAGFPGVDGEGGALFADGGCVVDLEGTTFSANAAKPGTAGALLAQNGSSVTATNCSFTSNTGYSPNGAIVGDAASPLTFTDCTFESNQGVDGAAASVASASFERCTFRANTGVVDPIYGVGGGRGGAVQVVGSASFVDCDFEDNFCANGVFNGGIGGAIAVEWSSAGTVTLTRCECRGNVVDGPTGAFFNGGLGGALFVNAPTTLVDCEIVDNQATNTHTTRAGRGGGIYALQSLTLTRTTIAGNSADSGVGPPTVYGTGGGIWAYPATATVTIDGSIVAGNTAGDPNGAPDVDGTIVSNGWNCIGDTTGTTVTGPGTSDLLDVDPLFADPANGDYTLSANSPCVESGDPSVAVDDPDVGGFPRVLDADLDRVGVVDRGAHEWSNVALAITGTPTPGATLTVDTSGTNGLVALLFVGTEFGEYPLSPYGTLFLDLSQTWIVVPWGVVPNQQQVDVDPSLPVPVTFFVQVVGLGAGDGNFSNFVEITIE